LQERASTLGEIDKLIAERREWSMRPADLPPEFTLPDAGEQVKTEDLIDNLVEIGLVVVEPS
ncbi:MAG: hypothetical protein R3C97_03325, partial [Geminicoccaceae bacterium]